MDFSQVKVGNHVERMLGGSIPMKLLVIEVTDDLIVCGGGWQFSRRNGAEIDEDIGWNEHRSGSFLTGVVSEQ